MKPYIFEAPIRLNGKTDRLGFYLRTNYMGMFYLEF
jgi:hypothetical protein